MKFKIIENENKSIFREGFYVQVKSYMGDADYHDSFNVGPFPKDKVEFLEEVIETLIKAEECDDPDDYEKDDNFQFWFQENRNCDDSPRSKFIDSLTFKNEARSFCYGWATWEGMNYKLSDYEVYYLDAFGRKYDVEIIN